MIYTVIWKTSAQDELARLWIQAPNRAALTQAANQIDALLRTDAHLRGDLHLGSTRILLLPPLGVIFQVQEPDRLVQILAVWDIPLYTTNGSP